MQIKHILGIQSSSETQVGVNTNGVHKRVRRYCLCCIAYYLKELTCICIYLKIKNVKNMGAVSTHVLVCATLHTMQK